ncbi:MAG TPA: alpha/beta hydrolase [Bacteroidia bacterium]|nr:alpha/beta hydrolase [Bacteroidia bacterium]
MKHVVFIPGLGADERIFSFINLKDCNKQFIKWVIPEKNESFQTYLLKIKEQIVIKQPPVIIGVSLGGIIAMELRDLIPVEKTIIISSVKTKKEMPAFFNWIRITGINKIMSPSLLKKSAVLIKPLITDTSNEKAMHLFKTMLHDADNDFIKRAIKFVLQWKRMSYNKENLIHIHGTKDLVFPLKNIRHYDYKITGGAHDMIMSKPEEINKILIKEIFQ